MSVVSGLHAGAIDCLVSWLVNRVRWLGVCARDELPDVTSEIRFRCFILNTDTKISLELTGSLSMQLYPEALKYSIYLGCHLEFIV